MPVPTRYTNKKKATNEAWRMVETADTPQAGLRKKNRAGGRVRSRTGAVGVSGYLLWTAMLGGIYWWGRNDIFRRNNG